MDTFKRRSMTYRVRPSKGGGTFFYTDCGHTMYSIKDETAYHGYLCPACLMNNVYTTLYIRGSDEANELFKNEEYFKKYA